MRRLEDEEELDRTCAALDKIVDDRRSVVTPHIVDGIHDAAVLQLRGEITISCSAVAAGSLGIPERFGDP